VAAAQAAVRNAEARRADTVISAPMAGAVTGRYMDPGTMATPGQPIVALQTASQVWVTFPVPEAASGGIHLSMPITVRLDAYPDRTFTARVVQVNPSADPASRQFQVRAALDDRTNLIKPGMFARVAIETSRVKGGLVVPREAIQQGKAGAEVVVVGDDNVAHKRPVSTGAGDAVGVVILSGLEPGERVVNLSASPVKDGANVRIGDAKQESSARKEGG
jgi:membrane fusion protein (multidrug efflux system)